MGTKVVNTSPTETAPGERTRVCRVVTQRTRDIDPIVHRQCRNIKPISDQRPTPAATTLFTRSRCHAILGIPSILGFPSGSAQEGT